MTNRRKYLIDALDRNIAAGLKARQRFADRVIANGVGSALEWSLSYLRDDQVGKVSAEFKPGIEDEEKPLEEMATVIRGRIATETGYISLGNTQMDLSSKITAIQAMGSVLALVESFIDYEARQ